MHYWAFEPSSKQLFCFTGLACLQEKQNFENFFLCFCYAAINGKCSCTTLCRVACYGYATLHNSTLRIALTVALINSTFWWAMPLSYAGMQTTLQTTSFSNEHWQCLALTCEMLTPLLHDAVKLWTPDNCSLGRRQTLKQHRHLPTYIARAACCVLFSSIEFDVDIDRYGRWVAMSFVPGMPWLWCEWTWWVRIARTASFKLV